MTTKPNDMAFPVSHPVDVPAYRHPSVQLGLTKREYFAAMAMQGICGDGIPGHHHSPAETAGMSLDYADALIAALSKVKP